MVVALKVTDANRKARVGVVARTFSDLKKKAAVKLKIKANIVQVVEEKDGTVIDEEYFKTLKNHTAVVVLKIGEKWSGFLPYVLDTLLGLPKLMKRDVSIKTQVEQLLLDNESVYGGLLSKMIDSDDKSSLSTRQKDPDWFENTESRFRTKEDYMVENAKRRIRGYLKEAKKIIQKSSKTKRVQNTLYIALDDLRDELKVNDYQGYYFSRSDPEGRGLCKSNGLFICMGPFDQPNCTNSHTINPYSSYSSRVRFSTWNLDHIIEKSRQVVPELIKAAEGLKPGKEINIGYFYKLLFTVDNLKLVDIVCHKKGIHSKCKCDTSKFYIKDS